MADSKFSKLRNIKSHPLATRPRKPSNNVSVTVHPRVIIPKKHQQKTRERSTNTLVLNVENCVGMGNLQQIENKRLMRANYLKVHFSCANATGAAPYKFDDSSIKWKLKGTHFVVNGLAMLDNLLVVWDSMKYAIELKSTTRIAVYVKIAKNMSQVMLRIAHAASVWNDADKYENIFIVSDDTSYSAGLPDLKATVFAFGVPIFGMIRPLSGGLEGITSGIHFMLIRHSRRIIGKIATDWGGPEENIDFPSAALGMIGFLSKLAGGIMLQAALTGPLMGAATLLSACKEFKYTEIPRRIKIETGNANNTTVAPGLQIGKRYGELKKISKTINHAFSPILKLLHSIHCST